MGIPGIAFTDTIDGVRADQLAGFFVGWSRRPSAELHLSVLRRSDRIVIARDTQTGSVAGFVTALTDGLMAGYITLLEVRPGYQRRGIGTQLVQRMLDALEPLYMIDALCDEEVLPFYRRFGVTPAVGVAWRDATALAAIGALNEQP